MPKMVNPIWAKIDACHNRLIPERRYRRKKKSFFLCILATKCKNIIFLGASKEAVLKISSHSDDWVGRGY